MKTRNPFLPLLLSGAMILSGCETASGLLGGSSSGVDPRLTSGGQAEFFSKSGLQACAVGAGAGVLGCAVSGNANAQCAIIAAVAACGVLMGANYYLEQKRGEYANKEDRLNAYIADVRKDTQQVQQINQSAKSVLAQNEAEMAAIDSQLKAGTLKKADAKQRLAKVDANISYLNGKLANMKKSQNNWRQVAAQDAGGKSARARQLNREIQQYNKQVEYLENQVSRISAHRAALQVG